MSIVTAVFNGANTLVDCIQSIAWQTYPDIEHIIIDGGSTDKTLDIIKTYQDHIAYWVSEPDEGLYHAMNKGIKAATGDVIGILNSDDIYSDKYVIETIVKTLTEDHSLSCYGDLVYVDKQNPDKVVRYWKANQFSKERFKRGWMPPHPTFFVRREVYEKYGLMNLGFPLAADYELMLRFLYKYEISTSYIPKVLVKMRVGGTSKPGLYTINAIRENYRAWKVNDLKPTPITFVLKPLSKLFQYFPKKEL